MNFHSISIHTKVSYNNDQQNIESITLICKYHKEERYLLLNIQALKPISNNKILSVYFMVRKLYILIFTFFTCSMFSSCDETEVTFNEVVTGKWYVNTVSNAGYSINTGYNQVTADYFMNFFYGDYMPFLKGDILDFSYDLKRSGFDGVNNKYDYNISGDILELTNDFRIRYSIITWNDREIILCFNKTSLIDYITSEMRYAAGIQYDELAYIREQVAYYVRDFYIEYIITRNAPSASEIISGNYYGNLSDTEGPLFDNDWVSATLTRQDPKRFNFILNDQISLVNGPLQGPPFNIEVPATPVGFGNMTGQIVFEGSSYMNHPTYGRIDMHITGQAFDSQTLETDITILNRGLKYNLYFRNGIRYLLIPEYYRTKSQPQEKKVIQLKPVKQ